MKRKCLRCDNTFKSEGSHNRMCFSCNTDINYSHLKEEENSDYYFNNKEEIMLRRKESVRLKRAKV